MADFSFGFTEGRQFLAVNRPKTLEVISRRLHIVEWQMAEIWQDCAVCHRSMKFC